ncbi:MAG: hypothetical protein Q7S37_02245 [bacterium]|nr:hypothetical protein [bacterium]
MKIVIFILISFASYAVGRISHILGGDLNVPHHWIYGVLSIIIGLIFYKHDWGKWLIAFGLGMVISDFKDMIGCKFVGPDDVKIKKFWGID